MSTVFFSGCSNLKTYQLSGSTKLLINSKTDSGIKTEVDVYHVNTSCQLSYQGTITVDNSPLEKSLSQKNAHYLVVRFSSSSFFTGSHSMSKDLMFKPATGKRYYLDLSYIDDIYNIELKESRTSSNKRKSVAQLNLNQCN